MAAGDRPLNVAVVGLGVGEHHAVAYARLEACRVLWFYDLDRAKAEAVHKTLGQGGIAEDLDTLLNDERVDVVSLASFDDAHAEQVIGALRQRKHLFVEKPLCRTLDDLAAIKTCWNEAGRPKLESNLILRAAPLYKWVKDAIEGGELGDIYAFDGDYLYGRLHKITEGWRKNVTDYSVMTGGGIHLADLMLWLTGQRPSGVTAVGNRICTRSTAFGYDDFVATTYRFDSGLVGRITANFGCVHSHQHVVRIFGTRGTFISDDQGPRMHRSRDPETGPDRLDLSPIAAGKGDLIPEFIRSIVDGGETADRVQGNFDLISVCVAADKALATGNEEKIQYV